MAVSTEESVHSLKGVIEELEQKLMKYRRGLGEHPAQKDTNYALRQEKLVNQLADIYATLEHLTLFDLFIQIQCEYDGMLNVDKEVDGLIIVIPLKEGAKRFGRIEFKL